MTRAHKKLILLALSAITVLFCVSHCSPENKGSTTADHKSLKSETESDDEALIKSDNGLLMQLSMEDVEKRLVKITWKNIGDTDLVLSFNASIASGSGEALVWPFFEYFRGTTPHWMPTALFIGFVAYGDNKIEMIDVLHHDGKPLREHDYPLEKLLHVTVEPGKQFVAIFDLGSLFDGIPEQDVEKVSVWFGYECRGGELEGDKYWRGGIDSNVMEIHR